MGQIHLRFPDHMQIDRSIPASIHVVGLDGIATPCRITREGQTLTITRNRDESGHVYLSWPTDVWGELVLVTGTLPEQDQPFRIAIELARGTVNRLRNQVSNWEEGGLEIPEAISQASSRVAQLVSQAVLSPDVSAAELAATRAIEIAVRAIFELSQAFVGQVLPLRLGSSTAPKFWFGCAGVGSSSLSPEELSRFDLIQIPPGSGFSTPQFVALGLGPLVDLSPGGLTAGLAECSGFESRQTAILKHAREALQQCPANVRMVHAVGGLNGTGYRLISYPQQLLIALDVLQICEDVQGKLPVMISFDNPWGERLSRSVGGTHPLQIADAMLRRGVRVSMLGLEINLDYCERGSLARDPLQWLDLLDLWGQLGLPLVLLLRAPSGLSEENESVRPGMSDSQRMRLLETVLPLVMTRQSVHGIVWQQLDDGTQPAFPGGGLRDASGKPKPGWELLNDLRDRNSEGAAAVADQSG